MSLWLRCAQSHIWELISNNIWLLQAAGRLSSSLCKDFSIYIACWTRFFPLFETRCWKKAVQMWQEFKKKKKQTLEQNNNKGAVCVTDRWEASSWERSTQTRGVRFHTCTRVIDHTHTHTFGTHRCTQKQTQKNMQLPTYQQSHSTSVCKGKMHLVVKELPERLATSHHVC